MSHVQNKILIVEDEPDLLEIVALFFTENYTLEVLKTSNPAEGLSLIEKYKDELQAIICDFNMPKINGDKIFTRWKELKPESWFILMTSDSPQDRQSILSHKFSVHLKKPFSEKEFVNLLKNIISDQNQLQEQSHLPISIETLLRIGKVSHPLFVKIGDDKYIKMINSGSVFDQQEYDRYKSKNINHLQVEKNYFKNYVEQFQKDIQGQLEARFGNNEQSKTKISAEVLDFTNQTLKTFGWSNETNQLLKQNIELVQKVAQNTKEISQFFKLGDKSIESDYLNQHAILISCLCTAFSKEYNFKFKNASELLTLAAFFHDISLSEHLVKNEKIFIKAIQHNSKVNKEELEIVKNHVLDSLAILSKWKECPVEVLNIIKKHHKSLDGKGFPVEYKGNDFNELESCFILAEDLVEVYLQKKSKALVIKHLQEKEKLYSQPPFQDFYKISLKWFSDANT